MNEFLAVVEALLMFACVVPALLTAVFAVEVLLSFVPPPRPPKGAAVRPRVAVLIPAHNEGAGVVPTVEAARAQLVPGDRLLVVADNCSDDTAAKAQAAGAEVIERSDTSRRGKGYALDFGVRYLAADPPEVLLMMDADCLPGNGLLDRLARVAVQGRPVQALYLMHAPDYADLSTRVAAFAWLVKNKVRPKGYAQLGLPCHIMGTGMAFPWPLIRDAELATGNIVEDSKMGLDFASQGRATRFLPDVEVTSYFPRNEEGVRVQRTRWEHGNMSMALKLGPSGLVNGLLRSNAGLFALSLDLMVPPLALLVLIDVALATACAGFLAFGGGSAPLVLSGGALAGLVVAVIAVWLREGHRILSLADLAMVPVYVLCKIPLYLSFVVNRQSEWVRSRRDDDN